MNRMLVLLDQGELLHFLMVVILLNVFGSKIAWEKQRPFAACLGSLAFLGYLGYRFCLLPPTGSDEVLDIALRGLLAGGLVFGLALFVLPVVSLFVTETVLVPFRKLRQGWAATAGRMRTWSRTKKKPEISTEDRLRFQQEASQRALAATNAQRRREDARAACELLFHLHAHSLGERFPKSVFDDFIQRYMGDTQSPDYVEQRGKQLTDLILQHAKVVSPTTEPMSLAKVLAEFEQQLQQIQQSGLDEEWKATLVAELQENLHERLQSTLETKP